MRTIDSLIDKFGISLSQGREASNGKELIFDCPLCVKRGKSRDIKGHFYLHVATDDKYGSFFCFRCGAKGRLEATTKLVENVKEQQIDEVSDESKKLELPRGFTSINKNMHAYKYLMSRGLTDTDILYYNIGFAKDRIVFPDYSEKGELVYWVSRSYTGLEPKYVNCKQSRSDKIYNLGRFIREKLNTVTIVEGPISAIMAGRSAVAVYGKQVTKNQISTLRALPVQKYFISLDPDARKESLELAKKLWKSDKQVYLVPVPEDHDPASLGREEFNKLKKESYLYHPCDKSVNVRFMLVA
jgi:DNA primase